MNTSDGRGPLAGFDLLAGASDCVQVLDAEGRVLRSNESARFHFGAGEGSPLLFWPELWPEDDRNRARQALSHALKHKVGQFIGARHSCGRDFWWDAGITRVDEGAEPAVCLLVITRDISEQKRVELALKESEARCRALFENLPIPAWEQDWSVVRTRLEEWRARGVADLDAYLKDNPAELRQLARSVRVLDVTDAALALLGTTRERVMSGGVVHAFLEQTWDEFRRCLVRFHHGATRFDGEGEILTADGQMKTVAIRVAVSSGHEKRLSRVVVSYIDITDNKKFERELRLNEERAQAHAADLEAVMEAAPVAILVTHDADCHEVIGNAAAYELLGVAEGRNLAVVAQSPEDPDFRLFRGAWPVPASELPMPKAARSGVLVCEPDLRVVRRDGTERSVICYAAPMRKGGTGSRGAVLTLLDVTERRRAELRMDLVATTAEGLLRTDEPQQVINQLCAKALDYLACDAFFNFLVDEESGRLRLNTCGGIHPQEAREIEWLDIGVAVCGCAVQAGQRIVAEHIADSNDPRVSHVKRLGIQAYACTPLRVRDRVLGTLSFGTRSRSSFTEDELALMKTVADLVAIALDRRRAESELRRANAELETRVAERTRSLEEMTEQLNGFCYSVAHDLRGPLRTQIGLARLLLDEFGAKLGDEGSHYARLIAQAAERQMDLVQDLMAHISVSRTDLPISPTDLRGVVEASLSDLALDIHKTHARVDDEGVEPVFVLANSPNLHLALMNLLSNALKFVPNTTRPQVRIWSETRDAVVRIWVQDNGIGIQENDLGRLFGMFQRLNPQPGYPGTGLGLALVKKAVEGMGGAVGVESQPGVGSRFWIELKQAGPASQDRAGV